MSLTIDGQANSITSSTAGVNIPATVGTLSVGPSGSYMNVTSSGVGIGTLTPQTTTHILGQNPVLKLQGTASTSGISGVELHANNNRWRIRADNNTSQNYFVIEDYAGGSNTNRLLIDSAGRVTTPYQPHAEGGITGLSNSSPSSSTIITFNRVDINVGNHYDTTNYRFNCPVNGNYLVHAHAQVNGQTATTANTVNFNIRKNAASVSGVYESRYYGGTAPGYVKLEITDVVYANAGDYLDIYAIISNTSLALEYGAPDIRWRFSYTLLG
jgi:hypothetical protein